MLEPQAIENLIRYHLLDQNLLQSLENQVWTVQYSKLGGRGLFAKRDIQQGEVIFVDKPLILGPRCYNKYLPMCVNCYKSGCPLFPCDNGCGLPVCSDECEKFIESYYFGMQIFTKFTTQVWFNVVHRFIASSCSNPVTHTLATTKETCCCFAVSRECSLPRSRGILP